jgi:acyl transferase domain-containing protein
MIVGSGSGSVLKRLAEALASRDNIRAVILGTGINNDGNDKVGYTAPSFRGQAAAIRAAHTMSGVARTRSAISRRTALARSWAID